MHHAQNGLFAGGIPGESANQLADAVKGAAVGMALRPQLARLLGARDRLDDERRQSMLAMLDGILAMSRSDEGTG